MAFRRKRFVMPPSGYWVVATIIRTIEPPELRKQIADHFATEFNKRSPSFDPYRWNRETGGTPAPNSAAA